LDVVGEPRDGDDVVLGDCELRCGVLEERAAVEIGGVFGKGEIEKWGVRGEDCWGIGRGDCANVDGEADDGCDDEC